MKSKSLCALKLSVDVDKFCLYIVFNHASPLARFSGPVCHPSLMDLVSVRLSIVALYLTLRKKSPDPPAVPL